MASSTRSGRRITAQSTQLDLSTLSNLECLILAQAVYEVGANAWAAVAKLLSKHPLLSRPKSFFTAQSCLAIYTHLMKQAELECSDANNAPHAACNLQLAQRHYQARFTELRDLIAAEEVKFKRVVTEIDEIRSGAWDDKIAAKVTGFAVASPTPLGLQENQPEPEVLVFTPPAPAAEEPFGSDLSKATDSGSPTSQRDHDLERIPQNTEEPETNAMEATATPEQATLSSPMQPEAPSSPTEETAEDATSEPEPVAARSVEAEITPSEPAEPESAPEKVLSSNEASPIEIHRQASVVEVDEHVTPETPNDDVDQAPSPTAPSRRRESKRKASDMETAQVESTRDKKRAREESEPVDEDDSGPSSAAARRRARQAPTEEQVASKRFQNVIGMLHSQISQHRNGNIFHNPIKNSEAPDYHDIVKRPIDLKTIKMRVKDGIIANSLEFQRDVYLMFANALMYNRPGSDIYQMAEEMMLESEEQINTFRQTEGIIRGAHRM